MGFPLRRSRFIRALADTIAACFISAGIIVAACVVSAALPASGSEVISAQVFLEEFRAYFNPEPVERRIFLTAVAMAVPATLTAVWLTRRATWAQITGERSLSIALFGIAAGLSLTFVGNDFLSQILVERANPPPDLSPRIALEYQLLAACLVTAVLFFVHLRPVPIAGGRTAARLWRAGIAGATLLAVASVRIRSVGTVYGDIHFEAVFFPVVQVLGGKTLIVDHPSQYGLYAELLRPLLGMLAPLSVLDFSVLMVVLQALAQLCILKVCLQCIRSIWLSGLAALSLCLFLGSTWIALRHDPLYYEYYQIWPIRLLFPAVCLLLYVRGAKDRFVGWTPFVLALTTGLGLVWNLESGVAAWGALVFSFFSAWLFARGGDRAPSLQRLALSLVVPIAVFAAFVGYMTLRSGHSVPLLGWLKYQSIFYGSGFGMLPMPTRTHPWMAVCAVYLFGLVAGIAQHARNRASPASDLMVFLSVLGIGLFAYYQGRSHDIVLSFVLWPALMLAFVLADQGLRAVRAKLLPTFAVIGIAPFVLFGVLTSLSLAAGLPRLLALAQASSSSLLHDHPEHVAADINFIRAKTPAPSSTVIIHPAQAALHAETGTWSAVGGPGLSQLLLVADSRRLLSSLEQTPVNHLFVMRDTVGRFPDRYAPLLSSYRIADKSAGGLFYLEPKTVPR